MTADTRRLSAHITAALAADPGNAIPGELIAEVVRGVLHEHRQDAWRPAVGSLLLEARHRLERLEQARVDNTGTLSPTGTVQDIATPREG